MLSDMIAAVKKAEADAALLIENSGREADGIMRDAQEAAAQNVKKTRDRVRAQTAKALFEQEERESALDDKAKKETLAKADAIRTEAQKHSAGLANAVRELMLA